MGNSILIKTVSTQPPGFVSRAEFAKECGVTPVSVTRAKQAGKFDIQNLRWLKRSSGQKTLLISWRGEGPRYIMSRPREKWPVDFVPPEEDIFDESAGTGAGQSTPGSALAITNIGNAKLREAQLKIEKAELDLQKGRNQVIDIEEVAGLWREIAMDVRQKVLAIPPRISSVLAAEDDPHDLQEMLEEALLEALTMLERGDNEYGKGS